LPSWQAYSSTGSRSFIVNGSENVHGRTHVVGSSMVTVHSSLSGDVRVKRSVVIARFR